MSRFSHNGRFPNPIGPQFLYLHKYEDLYRFGEHCQFHKEQQNYDSPYAYSKILTILYDIHRRATLFKSVSDL